MLTLDLDWNRKSLPIPLSWCLPSPRESWQLHQNQKELLTNLQRKCAAKHAAFNPRSSSNNVQTPMASTVLAALKTGVWRCWCWCFLSFLEGVAIFNLGFLRHYLTKYRCFCAHYKENFLHFSNLTLLLSWVQSWELLRALKCKNHFCGGQPLAPT